MGGGGESCRRRLPRRVTVKFVSAEGGASWERSVCHRPEPLCVSQHAVTQTTASNLCPLSTSLHHGSRVPSCFVPVVCIFAFGGAIPPV